MKIKTQTIHFNKKFGLITANQLVLTSGSSQNMIQLEAIEKVRLVKYRVIYTNIFMFIFSCTLMVFPTLLFHLENEKLIPFLVLGIGVLIVSIFHKFYFYRLEIKDDTNSSHTIKTTQLNRKGIKDFYYSLSKRISKRAS